MIYKVKNGDYTIFMNKTAYDEYINELVKALRAYKEEMNEK